MRVVVIGGYGNFGVRVCRGLAGSPGMEVVALVVETLARAGVKSTGRNR